MGSKMTPEKCELCDKICEIAILKSRLEDMRTAALITTSNFWTDEAREYMKAVADNAVPAIKSLEDQQEILMLKFKALEAST